MKKIIATILALCMILGLAGVANAEATTLTMWTFIAQHQEFYESMAKLWNEQNPDRQIDLQVTTIGYDDMHNKYKIALQADEGAPDLCDVELGQFPNVLTFSDKLTDLTPYMQDYMPDLVKARFEIYAKDGKYYGAPTHVGAMVAFYDVELLASAGVDYKEIKTWNDWLEVLLNGLVIDLFRVNDFQNPLGRHKIAGIQTNGSWIREFGYNLMKAHRYDKDATDVFTVEEPEVHTNYYLQNRKDRYDLSISEDILRQAMMESETGVATLINNMLALPYTSAEEDEYLIMRELFALRDRENPFYNVHIDDISKADDKQKTGLDIAQKIREKYLDFPFLHTEYNPEGLPAKTNDPVLFVTPRFLANFDVNVLASAFNMDKTNFMGRVETVDRLPLDGVPYGSAALLADPDIFVCADTKVKSASIQNPKNDSVNYFLHRWGIYGMSKFVNAVLFSPRSDTGEDITVIPTVTDVTVAFATINGATPEYATKGTTTRLTATVTVFVCSDDRPVVYPFHRLQMHDTAVSAYILEMKDPVFSGRGIYPSSLMRPVDGRVALCQYRFPLVRTVNIFGT